MSEPLSLASQLNQVTQSFEPNKASKLVRIQTMFLAIGDELGVDESVLICWRGSYLLGEKVRAKTDSPVLLRSFDQTQALLPENEKAKPAFALAESWNSAWERDESDLVQSVRDELGTTVEEKYFAAFERAASKIQPLRTS